MSWCAPGKGVPAVRVLLVGASSSIHNVRWANGLVSRGHEVHLASVHAPGPDRIDPRVSLHLGPDRHAGRYVTNAPWLGRLVRRLEPDVVNIHFATGYGLLARLARISRPTLLSVWGSDIYDTPRRNKVAERVVRGNLAAATRLASTSRSMARVVRRYAGDRPISITPFGIDVNDFVAGPRTDDGVTRVGTVKSLAAKYGTDDLIRAFDAVRSARPGRRLRLELYGDGPQRAELEGLVAGLGLGQQVTFHGAIEHRAVPAALAGLDVFAGLSTDWESFGVAVLEAGACGVPVVVTNTDGPAEVVDDGVTGLVVPRRDVAAAATAIGRLVDSPDLRRAMGVAARRHVVEEYSWEHSLDLMEQAYRDTVADAAARPRSRRRGR